MAGLRAYSHPKITKSVFIAEVVSHVRTNKFPHNHHWRDMRGCALGCSLDEVISSVHGQMVQTGYNDFERYLEIPRVLAALEDRIFIGLSKEEAGEWHLRFLQSIPEGADLSKVWGKFCSWVLREIALPTISEKDGQVRKALQRVIRGYELAWQNDNAEDAAQEASAIHSSVVDTAIDPVLYGKALAVTDYSKSAAYGAGAAAYAAAATAFADDACKSVIKFVYFIAMEDEANRYRLMADKLCEILLNIGR